MIVPLEIATQRINNLREKMKSLVVLGLKDLDSQIIDLNVAQMDKDGMNSRGEELPGPYAAMTIELKKMKGQRYDIITLHDTGDFHRAFEIEFQDNQMEIISTDFKTDMLMEQWGDDIFGLTEENKEFISNELASYLPQYIKPILNGNN